MRIRQAEEKKSQTGRELQKKQAGGGEVLMQRKPTSNTRGRNAVEKRFQDYTKYSDCIQCNREGPSIVDHVAGSTYRHNKVLIGHWFVIPLCVECDTVKTQGSTRKFKQTFGVTMAQLWADHVTNWDVMTRENIPREVQLSILGCGK